MPTPESGSTFLLMVSQVSESTPESETPTQRLASILLGESVQTFIATRRENGRPWRFIARDLYDATEGQIDVTHETLRQWHGDVAA